MDPISALGIAAAVVQFASLSAKIIKSLMSVGESASGLPSDVAHLDDIYSKLRSQSQRLETAHHNATRSIERETLDPRRPVSQAPHSDIHWPEGPLEETDKAVTFPTLMESYQNLKGLLISCNEECSKIMEMVAEVKSQHKSGWSWGRVREIVKLTLKKGDIEKIEERVSNYHRAVVTELCNISTIYHNIHHDNLANFRSESRRLGLEQSARLDSIESMLQKLVDLPRGRVGSARPLGEQQLADLEQMMAGVTLSEKDIANHLRILRTLTFETRTVRHEVIPIAHKQTFQWVFRKPKSNQSSPDQVNGINADTVGLLEWLASGDGAFWVSGKPGSGKSTFMKFLADHSATKKALSEWAHPLPVFVGSHYFWISGTAMQKSQEGLLRSLLFDIFSRCPELIRVACPSRWQAKEDSPWTVREMRSVIDTLSTQSLIPCKFCFFIDGLDEFDGEHLEFCESLLAMANSPNIKLCVSSRPWNVFEQALGQDQGRKMYIHELTKHDVFAYAQDRLQQHPRWKKLEAQTGQTNTLIQAISDKAQGVFLWVFLVTKQLREGLTNYDTLGELRKRLDSFPSDLEPFFMQIVKSVPDFYRERMAETLRIALADPEPLDALIYSYHDGEDAIGYYGTPDEIIECAARRINGRCRGLLEMNFMGQIGFLHRTVVDFLRTRDMSTFLDNNTPPEFSPNLAVLRYYGNFIDAVRFDDLADLSRPIYRALRYAQRAEFDKQVPKEKLDSAIDNLEYYAASKDIVVSKEKPDSTVYNLEYSAATKDIVRSETMGTVRFRTIVMSLPLTEYLMRKFAKSSNYLLDFRHPGALALLREVFPSPKSWSPEVPKLVGQLLRHGNSPNETIAGTGHTVWSSFLAELMPVSRHSDGAFRVSPGKRFCAALKLGLLPLFLRHGANPNVSLHDRQELGTVYTLPSYPLDRLLALAPKIPPDPATEQDYLDTIRACIVHNAAISRLEDKSLESADPHLTAQGGEDGRTQEHLVASFFDDVERLLTTDDSRVAFFRNVMRCVLPLVEKAEWPLDKYQPALNALGLSSSLILESEAGAMAEHPDFYDTGLYANPQSLMLDPSTSRALPSTKRRWEDENDPDILGQNKRLKEKVLV